jgi:hypothetical protein
MYSFPWISLMNCTLQIMDETFFSSLGKGKLISSSSYFILLLDKIVPETFWTISMECLTTVKHITFSTLGVDCGT